MRSSTRAGAARPPSAETPSRSLAMGFVLAGVGLISVVALVRGGTDEELRDELAALSAQVQVLRETLAEEQQARAALEHELQRVRGELARIEIPARTAPEPAPLPVPAPTPESAPAVAGDEPQPGRFDERRILAAGFSPSDVKRFRERVASLELERLHLRDQARREGWLDTPAFAMESRRIDGELAGLREEYDEDLYDWMLYAQGRPNRVMVSEVLAGSAADAAGLRTGDVIVRYDEALILSPAELGVATSAGQAGTQVEVEVQRGAETLRVFLPRGPIGVALEPRSIAPPPRRS